MHPLMSGFDIRLRVVGLFLHFGVCRIRRTAHKRKVHYRIALPPTLLNHSQTQALVLFLQNQPNGLFLNDEVSKILLYYFCYTMNILYMY